MKTYMFLILILAVALLVVGCGRRTATEEPPTAATSDQAVQQDSEESSDAEKSEEAAEGERHRDPFAEKAPTAAAVLAETAKAYKSLRSLELVGVSNESVTIDKDSRRSTKNIRVFFTRPGKLNYESKTEGLTEQLIADGKHIYLYRPDQKLYRKLPFKGKLTELPTLASPGINTVNLLDGIDVVKLMKNPKLLSDEKVGGVDTYVIRGTLPGAEGAPATQTIWIGKNDFMIRKNVMEGKIPADELNKAAPPGTPAVKGPVVIKSDLTMNRVVVDRNIPAATFTFKPPADVKEARVPEISDESPLLGKQAPDFTLRTLDGKDLTLSSLRGKVVLLLFFATPLPTTKDDLQVLEKLHGDLKEKNLVVLGVALDEDPGEIERLVSAHNITFQVTHGGTEAGVRTAFSYGAMQLPNTAIIGKDGTVRSHFIGSNTAEFVLGELKKAGI